jgi:UDP-N-acetylmuramoylalanine--D-glutamate ligase
MSPWDATSDTGVATLDPPAVWRPSRIIEWMSELADKQVLVVGLNPRAGAAAEWLCHAGSRVTVIDPEDGAERRAEAARLRALGASVHLGLRAAPRAPFAFAFAGPEMPLDTPLLRALAGRGIPVFGELELAFQQARCLSIAVAGTNGKSTTTHLVEAVLTHNHRRIASFGREGGTLASVGEDSKEADFLILEATAFELERTRFFRPSVAVLLNLAADHLDRYRNREEYVRPNAHVFRNQQPFDWAVVQAEALAKLKELGLTPPSKVVTFSAEDPEADLRLDRGLIISRLPNWTGPLLDTDQCLLRGPHHAENLMAALAVGHALRLPLEAMAQTLKRQAPDPHCCQVVAEIGGVQFIDDAKAANVDALHGALLATRPAPGGAANVWLIAGGHDKGLDFHEIGPQLSSRVKGAFLLDAAREKIRAAWSLFTPCTLVDSLLEAVTEAAKIAVPGDVVLLSPACSSFDQFRNYQQCGEKFCQIVNQLVGVDPTQTPI